MSLVPYAVGSAPYVATGAKRAYQWAQDNPDQVRQAANIIGGAWKARSRRKRRRKFKSPMYGEAPGTAGPKYHETKQVLGARDTRSLYNVNMLQLTRTQNNEINQRQRDIVNIRGIKTCVEMENLSARPLWVHTALIVPKNKSTTFGSGDFFRGSDNSDRRSEDFSLALDSIQMRCLPINTDEWHIICHKRTRLAGTSSNDKTGSTSAALDVYSKVNRQFRFEGSGSNTCVTPIYFVYWADNIGIIAGSLPAAGAFNLGFRNITYFREPKTIY